MGPSIIPTATDTRIPASTDVVIIGGGIIGIATAWYLAKRKMSVVVCEKGNVAGEQSSRNLGWIRKLLRGPALMPLSLRSEEIWAGLNAQTGAETGYRRRPMVVLARNDRIAAEHGAWLDSVSGAGLAAYFASRTELHDLVPGLQGNWSGGLVDPHSGGAEPTHATSALACAARAQGATVVSGLAVRDIEMSAGRISGVVTEKGPIACNAVVLAGGAWSRLFCRKLGIEFPQLKILMSLGRSSGGAGTRDLLLGADNILMRPHIGGGHVFTDMSLNTAPIVPDSFLLGLDFLPSLLKNRRYIRVRLNNRFREEWSLPKTWAPEDISSFERHRVLDPDPVRNSAQRAITGLKQLLPGFSDASVEEEWAGLVDFTPDELPVMSGIDSHPGLFLASGFSGMGFGVGPASGELVADLVAGDRLKIEPTPFSLDRFSNSTLRGRRPSNNRAL